MRRLWTFILAGAAIAFTADAADAQIRIGAKGGVSLSDASLEPEDDSSESITGFAGGAEVTIALGASGLSIQPEVLYIRKGVGFDDPDGSGEIQLDYVEIPILFRYDIPSQSVTPYLFAGGAIAFEASCTLSGDIDGTTDSVDCDDPDLDDILETESTDFGVLFGGGIAFPAGPGSLFVDVRYNIGLADVEATDFLEAKNRSGAAMIGYSVSLDPTSR